MFLYTVPAESRLIFSHECLIVDKKNYYQNIFWELIFFAINRQNT